MGNALDYISWRGDLSFDQSPVNEVDIFIFAQIIAANYKGIIGNDNVGINLKEAVDAYFETHSEDSKSLGMLQSIGVLPSLKAMASSVRYKNLILKRYLSKVKTSKSEQFCGLSVECPGNFLCVVFQGTDDTIIGWKEDFELASARNVASHDDAVKYLNKAISSSDAPKVFVCGHSKGGHLSLYSAVNCDKENRDRITTAISFDGPGFRDDFFENENYQEIKKRLVTVLSDYSSIGLLMKQAGRRVLVKSDVTGPTAHDGYYWEVSGPRFVKTTRLSKRSLKFKQVLDDLLLNTDDNDRQEFTDEFFSVLLSTGATTITELTQLSLKQKADLLKELGKNPHLSAFAKMAVNSFFNPE